MDFAPNVVSSSLSGPLSSPSSLLSLGFCCSIIKVAGTVRKYLYQTFPWLLSAIFAFFVYPFVVIPFSSDQL